MAHPTASLLNVFSLRVRAGQGISDGRLLQGGLTALVADAIMALTFKDWQAWKE
jgi:hypothetical protein